MFALVYLDLIPRFQFLILHPRPAASLLRNWLERLIKSLAPHWCGCQDGLPEYTPSKVGAVSLLTVIERAPLAGGPGATVSLMVKWAGWTGGHHKVQMRTDFFSLVCEVLLMPHFQSSLRGIAGYSHLQLRKMRFR